MAPVEREFDVVITSNSGYPLDLNLYQAVKGMSAAARVVRQDGTIIVAAECWDGIPEHGLFAELIAGATSPDDLLATLRTAKYHVRDAWQAHIFALIRSKAHITLVSSGLGEDQVPKTLCDWAPSVEAALERVRDRMDRAPSVCVLPDGPLTIPTVVG
jgi:nickel-dependent lactate racemase